MGMYTGVRFKGYVKPEFRKGFETIALSGYWEDHSDQTLSGFGKIGRSSFIPCGSLAYMPDCWESYDNNHKKYSSEWFESAKGTDGFERSYDEDTGYWTFQCSLKNYESEIEEWFKIVPYFIEKIEHLEYFYEEWTHSSKYELTNGDIICADERFIEYQKY